MRTIAKILLSTTLLVIGLPVIAEQSETQDIEPQSDIATTWDNAKNSTKKALEQTKEALEQTKEAGSAIWQASKESTQEAWSDSQEISEQVWDSVKEKSATAIEKSQTLLKQGSEKMDSLLENEPEPAPPENTDEIL